MTSTGALSLKDIPKSLLVVGGGIIGLELGQFYSTFGSEVTVVEVMGELVTDIDRDVFRFLEKRLKTSFKEIHFQTMVTSIKAGKNDVECVFEKDGKNESKKFSRHSSR